MDNFDYIYRPTHAQMHKDTNKHKYTQTLFLCLSCCRSLNYADRVCLLMCQMSCNCNCKIKVSITVSYRCIEIPVMHESQWATESNEPWKMEPESTSAENLGPMTSMSNCPTRPCSFWMFAERGFELNLRLGFLLRPTSDSNIKKNNQLKHSTKTLNWNAQVKSSTETLNWNTQLKHQLKLVSFQSILGNTEQYWATGFDFSFKSCLKTDFSFWDKVISLHLNINSIWQNDDKLLHMTTKKV